MQGAQADVGDVGPTLHQVGRDTQGGRADVGCAEAHRVGDDAREQTLGDAARQRRAHLAQEAGQDFGRRAGVRLDDVERAEAGVGDVVVDVGQRRLRLRQRGIGPAHARLVGAIDGDDQIVMGLGVGRAAHVGGQRQVVKALWHSVVADQRDALAELLQRLAGGRQRADGVAVRVNVGNDQHAVGFFDGELDHRLPPVGPSRLYALSACSGSFSLPSSASTSSSSSSSTTSDDGGGGGAAVSAAGSVSSGLMSSSFNSLSTSST